MSLFDTLIVQPIFNVLALIYGIIPGADFGVAVIILTVLVRLALWPLVKKQLHQTKVMRAIQPELKKIKARAKGNKQLEGQMMMELYRERGVNPFSSIGLLLLQLPIYIALYSVIDLITKDGNNVARYTYDFLEGLGPIQAIIQNPTGFNESLFGVIDLARRAVEGSAVYWPVFVLAIVAAVLQYVQSKQVTPQPTENRKLRDLFKDQAAGRDVDQSEVSALVTSRMLIFFPLITLFVAIYLPGALVLYFVVSSAVAIIQQYIVLNRDEQELETIADAKTPGVNKAKKAKNAEIIKEPADVKSENTTENVTRVVIPNQGTKKAKKRKKR